ncbi:MAG TPA: nuclear transport factor 2 family protein [Ramlibacter sp.]|nr:nuclear transport factor 2 family protein [Ramlibacter sp.]
MNTLSLEAQVRRLADLEELRQLKFNYARLVDKMLGEHTPADEAALANVFTEDARADFGARLGCIEGRAAIMKLFTETLPFSRSWFMHYVANPVLAVEGDTARGEWMVMALTENRGGFGERGTVTGRYFDEYLRTPEGWRVSRQAFLDETRK